MRDTAANGLVSFYCFQLQIYCEVSSSSSSFLSSSCWVFTIIYLKQPMFLVYTVLQLFCIYNLCYM